MKLEMNVVRWWKKERKRERIKMKKGYEERMKEGE
jgi:hypothetical protein